MYLFSLKIIKDAKKLAKLTFCFLFLKVSSVCLFYVDLHKIAAFGSDVWVLRNFGATACFFGFIAMVRRVPPPAASEQSSAQMQARVDTFPFCI